MKFNDKLTILMDITKTSNQQLAVFSNLDSSYISRLKTGNRRLVKNASYIMAFSQFFSRHIQTHAQRDIVFYLLGLAPNIKIDSGRLAEAIYSWLIEDSNEIRLDPYGVIGKGSLPDANYNPGLGYFAHCNATVYFKDKGKGLATLAFLEMVAKEETPRTLLLYSDEDMSWMIDDTEYINRWSALMKTILSNGNKIKIIHNLNRGLDEFLAAIRIWSPLYMTGSIDPYYYPRIRDGVFKRTIFVAPGICAVSSTSVENMSSSTANSTTYLFTKKEVLTGMQNEFEHYLALCNPLMEVLTEVDCSNYHELVSSFEGKTGATIIKTTYLSALTMPEELFHSILKRNLYEKKSEFLSLYKYRADKLRAHLVDYSVTEIFSIPQKEDFNQDLVTLDLSSGLKENFISYTIEEYIAHLRNIIHLLEDYENYNVYVESLTNDLGYSVCAKEESGLFLLKNKSPFLCLYIENNDLTKGFWDYLSEIIRNKEMGKKSTISRIKKAIKDLST